MTASRVGLFTLIALLCFAANSVLCRLALGSGSIDAASFTTIRLLSGAIVLSLLLAKGTRPWQTFHLGQIASLLLYMVCFSFAYLSLDTGTGALILFAVVQLTMFSVALVCGERFTWLAWVGLSVAFAGLIVLVAPGLQAPNAKGALLMALAGLGWGWYSLLGRHNHSPLQSTASNFLFAVPVAAIVSLIFRDSLVTSSEGVIYAVLSGALASGVGYAVWYHVLPRLAASHAAVVQLFVPMLAAVGGVLFSQESITLRLVISGVVTITGVYLVLRERNRPQP